MYSDYFHRRSVFTRTCSFEVKSEISIPATLIGILLFRGLGFLLLRGQQMIHNLIVGSQDRELENRNKYFSHFESGRHVPNRAPKFSNELYHDNLLSKGKGS